MFRRIKHMWEHRNSPYTDAITTQILASAQGTSTDLNPKNTGAAFLAASVISRAFSSADVDGIDIDPGLMGDIGFDLVIRGESLIVRNSDTLVRPSHWDITGQSPNQDQWNYKIQIPRPSGTGTVVLKGINVCHPRWNPDPVRPWVGVPPMDRIPEVGRLLAAMEKSLGDEQSTAVGYLLPLPTDGQDNTIEELKKDIGKLEGKTAIVETTQSGWGRGPYSAPSSDWRPQRIGPTPPQVAPELLRLVNMIVLASMGLPIELLHHSDGTGQREAWRRTLHSTLQPLARIVEPQLSRLSPGRMDVTIDFHKLFASDITGRARAFASMVNGGMDVSEAATKAGLLQEED